MQGNLFGSPEDERPKAPALAWLDEYHAYQRECHARGEASKNVSDWLTEQGR